jgi:hypothetical protein
MDVDDAAAWMQKAVESAGNGIRTNKNMLVFLVPEKSRLAAIRSAVSRWLALKEVEGSPSFKEMDADDREQVRNQLRDKEAEIEALLKQAYQDIYRPSESGLRKIPSFSPEAIKAKTLDEFVAQVLEKAGELIERVAPEFIKEMLPIEQAKEVPITQATNLFTGTPGQPIPKQPQQAIYKAIQDGVKQGQFAVKVGDEVYVGKEVPEEVLRDSRAVLVPPVSPPTPPPPSETKPVTLRIRTSTKTLYALLVVAEQLRNLDATVALEVHDATGKMSKRRSDIEKLLRDYGCAFEWVEEAKKGGV